MAKYIGWIRLHRSSFNNKLYFSEPFTRWQAWSDLLLIANHSEGWIRVRGIKQPILRGQIGYSMVELSKRWVWSKGKVIRFLNELRDEHQVVLQKDNITTLISIVNYNKYQTDEFANDTANRSASDTAESPQTGSQTDTNKNVKNDNNDKKEINIKNISGSDFAPAPPNSIFPKYENYNGLPERNKLSFYNHIRVTKDIIISKDDIDALWEVFKEQNLTGEKPYKDDSDIYRHFHNWGNKQSFRKKTVPKEKKTVGKVIGIEFINNFSQCKMSDGSLQDLTDNQRSQAEFNHINPKSIIKN